MSKMAAISSTILPENYDQMLYIYKLAKELGVGFSARIAHDLERQNFSIFQLKEVDRQLNTIADDMELNAVQSKPFRLSEFYSAQFLRSLIPEYKVQKRPISCKEGFDSVLLDPYGDFYICPPHSWDGNNYGNQKNKIANLVDNIYEEFEINRQEKLKELNPLKCHKCWTECSS
jgi:radical SAM protein with 4Fe4S-binding SPASM domain